MSENIETHEEWKNKWFYLVFEGIQEYNDKLVKIEQSIYVRRGKINALKEKFMDNIIRKYILFSSQSENSNISSEDDIITHKIDLINHIKANIKSDKDKKNTYKEISKKLDALETKINVSNEKFDVNKELQEILALDVY
jgi:hypothetical protein